MLPSVNDDEDLILEGEKKPRNLCASREHIGTYIDMQDIAIFKSQKDYVGNKQKLLEYICYAQMWQVLLVTCSYAAFTCDIVLEMYSL